jgi:hypothetical protein
MSETRTFPRGEMAEPAPVAQWVGLFLAPLTYAAHLQIVYVLVRWACVTGGEVWVHLMDLLAVVLALVGAYAAWRTWTSAGRVDPGEEGGPGPRTRFLGVAGLGFSSAIALLLLWQAASAFFISMCQ